MLFRKTRELKRYHAALCRYEDLLMRKDSLLKEAEDMLSMIRQQMSVVEECNETLTRENKRLADNQDTDRDLLDELYGEYTTMVRQQRDYEALRDENYRLWVENTLLKAELLKFDPPKAAAIAGKSRR